MQLDAVQSLACAGAVLLLGQAIKRRVHVLERYNLPGPVVGGMTVALLITLARPWGESPLQFDLTAQTPLMIAFFTALGFGASISLLRRGGPQVALFLLACTVLAVLQNLLGVAAAYALGQHPLLGVLVGSVTLTGGPGTGLAFAPSFQAAGVHGAATLAITAAMGGITLGGILGTPVATGLIERLGLRGGSPRADAADDRGPAQTDAAGLLKQIIALLLAMGLGSILSGLISQTGLTLPSYIGAMVVAAMMRNVDDRFHWFGLDATLLDDVGGVALSFFLALSLMTLKLWELAAVALPMLVLLVLQAALIVLVARTVMFRLMGRDYDAAIMSGGLIGFMMGTTANAMANMDALTRKYGSAPRAYLVVPLVGACFIDFTNSVLITVFLNAFSGR